MRFLSILVLLIIHSNTSSAETIVDLRSEMGKIRNQSNKGWCYANAAADLLSHKFLEPAKNQAASAIFMALSYIHEYEDGDGIMDGGYDYRALLAAKDIGLCPAEFDQKVLWSGFNIGNLKEKLVFIGELYALKKKILHHKHDDLTELQKLQSQWDLSIRKLKSSNSVLAPLLAKYSDKEISDFVAKTDEENFYFELAKVVCLGKQIHIPNDYVVRNTRFINSPKTTTIVTVPGAAPLLPVRYVNPDKKRFYYSRVHQTHTSATKFDDLSKTTAGWIRPTEVIEHYLKKRIPVSISYYSSFLSKNYLAPGFAVREADLLRTGSHASVVVAERRVERSRSKNKEFLIRNSWGDGCGSYDVALRATHCEKGHIWVPEDVLNVFLNEVTAIE